MVIPGTCMHLSGKDLQQITRSASAVPIFPTGDPYPYINGTVPDLHSPRGSALSHLRGVILVEGGNFVRFQSESQRQLCFYSLRPLL